MNLDPQEIYDLSLKLRKADCDDEKLKSEMFKIGNDLKQLAFRLNGHSCKSNYIYHTKCSEISHYCTSCKYSNTNPTHMPCIRCCETTCYYEQEVD